jgi:hypothetical protein
MTFDIPTTTPEDAAAQLEAALAVFCDVDTEARAALDPAARAGSAAGLIMVEIMHRVIAAAVNDGTANPAVQAAMVYAVAVAAAEDGLSDALLHAYTNILQLWAIDGNMNPPMSSSQALSIADHLEHVKAHLDGDKEPHDLDTDDGPFVAAADAGQMPSPGTDDDDALVGHFPRPHTDPVQRLTGSCKAMGFVPLLHVHSDDPRDAHPGYTVAVLAGALASRSTLEMVNAVADVDQDRASLSELWCRGFTMGLVTTADAHVDQWAVSGVMMRMVNMVAAWHWNQEDSPRARIIADLCMGAVCAGRADGLTATGIETRAEYVALHGIDVDDSHRDALEYVESALAALRTVDTM